MSGVPLAALKIFLIIIGFEKVESNRKKNINETKIWLFEKNNRIDNPLARPAKGREKTQITSNRNKRGDIYQTYRNKKDYEGKLGVAGC